MSATTKLGSATSAMAANGFDAARQATSEAGARARGVMQNSLMPNFGAFSKASNGVAQLGHDNLEAVAQSAQAYMTGMQDFSGQYAAAMQGLMQRALESAQAFAGVKSMADAMAVQANLTRASVDWALGEGAKLQQATLKMTEQVYAPLTQHAMAAIERTKQAQAD